MECHQCCVQKLVQAFAEADLERGMGRCQSKRLKEACKKLQEDMQNVCLTCVEETNDNNPSNHGQTFYSLDSGHCQSGSGRSAYSHSDNNEVISRADWINSHASYDSAYYQDSTFRPYSGNSPLDNAFIAVRKAMRHAKHTESVSRDGDSIVYESRDDYELQDVDFLDPDADGSINPFQDEFSITTLPSPVEAILLREMNNFAALPALHQMLICCLLAGINISDFARMGWLPKEIRRLMKPRSKDMEVITAQTAHAIYQNICKKLPYLTVLARATKKRSKERVESQNAAIRDFQAENGKMVGYLNSPDTMITMGKPKTNPHAQPEPEKSERQKRIEEKRARQEYLAKKYQQETLF